MVAKKLFLSLSVMVFSVFSPLVVIAQPLISWSGFNEGSWVIYELSDGIKQKQTLVSKTDTEAVIKYENIYEDNTVSLRKVVPLESEPIEITAAAQEQVDVQESSEIFLLKDASVSCRIYETQTAKGKSKLWLSDEVPGGIVQSELNDKITIKLLDYEVK